MVIENGRIRPLHRWYRRRSCSSGDDAGAKGTVTSLLRDFGWPDGSIVDLGGIGSARGPEHYFLMFVALMQSLRGPGFNIRLVT